LQLVARGAVDASRVHAQRATLNWCRLLDLATQVQAKYSLDKTQAQRDVDAFAKGRQL